MSNSENLRLAMRHYPTGVCVVTSLTGKQIPQGMTANSFVSVSLDPPSVTVTMAVQSRTYQAVMESQVFAVTMLSFHQKALADRFAGRTEEDNDRFVGVDSFTLQTGAPLLVGGLAWLDCRVVHSYPVGASTLFVGEVLISKASDEVEPLVYLNQKFHKLGDEI